ncbi:hypothetical protein BX666DRAFT_253981 [Dichotomocladium elegans]|nr:hypothetical protein BX666DRAFT_253981 [Dichotomocladium elegans]
MSWICMLCKADHVMTEVVLKPMPGQSPHTNRIRAFLPTSARGSGKYDLTIAAFLSPNILKRFFDRPASLLTVSAVQDHQSTYNRFRNFLSTNSVAGLIQVEAYPTEVLAILPYTREIAMGWKLDNWAPENMLAIYLEHMPPPVPLLHDHVELGYHSRPSTHSRMMYRWYLLAAVLKFTPQLIEKFRPNTTIEIYGSSKWAAALERACSLFVCKSSKATERVVLFDRYDQSQFKKNLFQLKRSDIPTSFWEFGIHSLTVRSIMKPIQLYPLLRGGYVMTDIPNIMADPDILLRISSAVYQLNANPANGDWAFVLQYDVFDRLREQAIGSPSAKKVQLALILLANIMSENKCRVMREWGRQPADTLHQSSSTVRFMEGLVRCFCYKAESFVLVDDISSMSGYLAVIETCQSTELYGNYKMPRELYNSPRSSI